MTRVKLFTGLGALLMIGAFIYLLVGISVQGSPFSASLFQALLCGPDETLKVSLGETYYDFSYDMGLQDTTYVCVNAAGAARNVSQQFFYGLAASYVVPFLVGLGLLLFGFNRREKTEKGEKKKNGPGPAGGGSSPEAEAALETVVEKLATAGAEPLSGDLAHRMKQLEAARDQGLITEEEHIMARVAVLASTGKRG